MVEAYSLPGPLLVRRYVLPYFEGMTVTDLWAPAAFDESLYRAFELFSWLAMQGMEPFLPRFGLGQLDAAELREVAREYLTMYDGLSLSATARPRAQFAHALDAVEQIGGKVARTTVATWHTLGIPDGSPYSRAMTVWFHVLHDAAYDDRATLKKALLAEVRPTLRDRLSPDRWLEAVDAAKEPSDGWEVRFYAMWEQSVGHYTSPIDGLRGALNFNDLHDSWFDLRSTLKEESIQGIASWVKRQAMRALWFGPLPPPERQGWDEWRVFRDQGS